jgi:hypothetical protein
MAVPAMIRREFLADGIRIPASPFGAAAAQPTGPAAISEYSKLLADYRA